MKRKILITAVGGDIGQSVVRCIKKYSDDTIIGCDIDFYAAGKKNVDKFFIAPKSVYIKEYADFINEIVQREGITHIIPITEDEIKIFSDMNKKEFLLDVKIAINHKNVIDIFLDKWKTIEFFEQNNILAPRTFEIENYNNELKYPFILKEKNSRGSKGVHLIHDDIEFNKYHKKHCIVQEYLENDLEEYTMTIFSDGYSIYNIAFRRTLGYGSLSKFVELINDIKLDTLAKVIAEKIKLVGCINVQMRKKDNEFLPFEVNPRISSTVAFRDKFEFKDPIWWLNLLDNDLDNIVYIQKYKKGIGVRTVEETFFDLELNDDI